MVNKNKIVFSGTNYEKNVEKESTTWLKELEDYNLTQEKVIKFRQHIKKMYKELPRVQGSLILLKKISFPKVDAKVRTNYTADQIRYYFAKVSTLRLS